MENLKSRIGIDLQDVKSFSCSTSFHSHPQRMGWHLAELCQGLGAVGCSSASPTKQQSTVPAPAQSGRVLYDSRETHFLEGTTIAC